MARQKIPVLAVIGNDAGWTQIRRGQVELYGEERAVATALEYTRYEKVVEACGGAGFWAESPAEVGAACAAGGSCSREICSPSLSNSRTMTAAFWRGVRTGSSIIGRPRLIRRNDHRRESLRSG